MVNKVLIDDINSFNELGEQVHKDFYKLFNLHRILESNYDFVFGYYDESKLVGFIHINKLYETMDIINIVVDLEYRRKGIGTKLLNYVFNLFDDVEKILLEVNVNNISAISLYKKNGFNVIDCRKKYYGDDDALIMKRDVKNERC